MSDEKFKLNPKALVFNPSAPAFIPSGWAPPSTSSANSNSTANASQQPSAASTTTTPTSTAAATTSAVAAPSVPAATVTSSSSASPVASSKNASGASTPTPSAPATPLTPSSPVPEKEDLEDGEEGGRRSKASSSSSPASEAEDSREHINIVFIGHVDAGKSTIGGHIMYLTGQVDKRTLEKYEREAKEKGMASWYLSWALDTNPEEREKGKTVEVGRAYFDTPKKRFTILDAPGHKSYVPNMISGAAQADIAVLVISARKGEFETGFERGGQTREHAMLAKTAGVKHLVVAVNKMDDPTVNWSQERYDECVSKITPFLKQCGYNMTKDVTFMPISGFGGHNLKDPLTPDVCPWYSGKSLLTFLDDIEPIQRANSAPVRLPIIDKFKDMGINVLGKLESGSIQKGDQLVLMPNKISVSVVALFLDEREVNKVTSGENIRLKLNGLDENDVSVGFVICSQDHIIPSVQTFDAQIALLEYKSIICAGFSCIMHVHTAVSEVTILDIVASIDKKTNKIVKGPKPKFIKQGSVVIARMQATGALCMETFKEFPQLGRITLRDEGKSIAIGKILKLNPVQVQSTSTSNFTPPPIPATALQDADIED